MMKARPALPHGTRDRELRQRLRRLDDIDFVDEQAEAIAQIHNGSVDRTSSGSIEHEAHRVFLAADPERMDFL